MKHNKRYIALISLMMALSVSGGLLPACAANKNEGSVPPVDIIGGENGGDVTQPPEEKPEEKPENPNPGNGEVTAPQPEETKTEYIKVNSSGVNLRKGAGTSYASVGAAEQGTLYAMLGRSGNWYKTYYKNQTVYISANYCTVVQMDKSANDAVEDVIAEGTKHLGVKYVYGATRYHDGTGKLLSGFTTSAFDCSSLMQYMFKVAAGVNLQLTTRTQIFQGKTVAANDLRRGDLMFFTNASRKDYTGLERVGHVAIYLGGNYILHTASDYAKIEQISSTRWSYYIQSQRIL